MQDISLFLFFHKGTNDSGQKILKNRVIVKYHPDIVIFTNPLNLFHHSLT